MASPTQDDTVVLEESDTSSQDQMPIAMLGKKGEEKRMLQGVEKRMQQRKNLQALKRQSEAAALERNAPLLPPLVNQPPQVAASVETPAFLAGLLARQEQKHDSALQVAQARFAEVIAQGKQQIAASAALRQQQAPIDPLMDRIDRLLADPVVEPKKKRGRPKGSRNVKGIATRPTSSNSANYSLTEDICLARAFVNVSLDPTKGANQKADAFWSAVQEKYQFFMEKEDKAGLDLHPRAATSLRERFKRKIQVQVNQFNPIYVNIKKVVKSGWQDADYMKEALARYLEVYGKPFEYEKCLEYLWTVAKYDVSVAVVQAIGDEASVADHSKVGSVQGQHLTKPTGSKAAKRAMAEQSFRIQVEKRRAKTDRDFNQTNRLIGKSMVGLDHTVAKQRIDDTTANLINWYMSCGMEADARRLMKEVEETVARERAAMFATSTPTNNLPGSVAIHRETGSPASEMSNTANADNQVSPGTEDPLRDGGFYADDDDDEEEENDEMETGVM